MRLSEDLPTGGHIIVSAPDGWLPMGLKGAVLAVAEPVAGRFAPNLIVLHDPTQSELLDPIGSASVGLVAPLVLDFRARADALSVDLLLSHIVGPVAVTAWQRQLVSNLGLVAVTLTAPTVRWDDLGPRALTVLESLVVFE